MIYQELGVIPPAKHLHQAHFRLTLPTHTQKFHDTASYARVYQARNGWQTTTKSERRTQVGFHTPTHASNYIKTDGQLLKSGNDSGKAGELSLKSGNESDRVGEVSLESGNEHKVRVIKVGRGFPARR